MESQLAKPEIEISQEKEEKEPEIENIPAESNQDKSQENNPCCQKNPVYPKPIYPKKQLSCSCTQ